MPSYKKSLFSSTLSGKGYSQFYYFDAVNFHGGWQPKPTVMFINASKCLGKRLVSWNLQSTDSNIQLCLVGTMCSNIMPCGIRISSAGKYFSSIIWHQLMNFKIFNCDKHRLALATETS